MGIFSLFGKKNNGLEKASSDKTSSKKTRSKSLNNAIAAPQDDEAFSQSVMAQRHIARATERKIDAIEFEMSRDMGRATPSATPATPAPNSLLADAITQNPISIELDNVVTITDFPATLPASDFLFNQSTDMAASALTHSESVPLLEEAAILFASGQKEVAEQMLQSAIQEDNIGSAIRTAWYMLFDLYQISNDKVAFEKLSLEYASTFETSPPVWDSAAAKAKELSNTNNSDDVTPNLTFPSQLDANVVKLLGKLQELSKQSRSLRLDFTRVKSVDPVGCGLLLRTLNNLKKTKHELVLVSAQDLTEKIRAILEVGRRDETEAPWLLLLEILQLLHFEKAFEETSIDYCVTFEVSPPSFEAPKNRVITAAQDFKLIEEKLNHFMMPAIIEGRTDILISQIAEYAKSHTTVFLDCSLLERVEFGASAQLLSGLVPIAAKKETQIQFHEVNHLVMCLFNAMGLKNVAAIFPRKR